MLKAEAGNEGYYKPGPGPRFYKQIFRGRGENANPSSTRSRAGSRSIPAGTVWLQSVILHFNSGCGFNYSVDVTVLQVNNNRIPHYYNDKVVQCI